MSYPHNFSDEPPASTAHSQGPSTATTVLIIFAIIGGTMFLACGGLLIAGYYMAQKMQNEFEVVLDDALQQDFQTDADLTDYYPLRNSGQYPAALHRLESQLELYPNDAMLHNEKAWMLATCPVAAIRNGKVAVEHATKACELTEWEASAYLDTLAAAHAETRDFEAAVKWQQAALEADLIGQYRGEFEARLQLYQDEQPYREEPRLADGRVDLLSAEPDPTTLPPADDIPPTEVDPEGSP